MKFQITLRPHQPHAGKLKFQLRTLTLAALLFMSLLPIRLSGQTEPSALMEIQSTDKGFLLPRLTQEQRDAIVSPATGLMIYNTSANCLQVNYGSPATPSWSPLGFCGTVGTITCSGANVMGTLTPGQALSGVSVSVPYTGGDGGAHPGQTVSSTGVTGLTATLAAGSFASGGGNLTYAIAGTPAGYGPASFALKVGGKSCSLSIVFSTGCRAKVSGTDYKDFMCHNLGSANTAANPLVPSWEIIGGYWQWGRKGPDPTQWLNTNTPNFVHGPTGPGTGAANEAAINDWNQTLAPNGSWMDAIKTANDPCPQGFRVPTVLQWEGVQNNNTKTAFGPWVTDPTNYGSGLFLGPDLMLPTTGNRTADTGLLNGRGGSGRYWSSTETGNFYAWNFTFYGVGPTVGIYYGDDRRNGEPIRCIAEY